MKKTIPIIPFYNKLRKYEISCVLFDKCNLKCPFCFEADKRYKIDVDYILSIPQILIDNFNETIKRDQLQIDFVNVMFWGGEVFFDGVPDQVFATYHQIIDQIINDFKTQHPNIKLHFHWLSNGVFTKRARVERLLQTYRDISTIGFSYDPVNRFASELQRNSMIDNALYFKKLGFCDTVSITLTKPNIEAWLRNIDDLIFFKQHDLLIDTNFYIANPNWETYLANDQLIYQWMKKCIDNRLFNIMLLKKILWKDARTRIDKFCDCHQCSQITNGVWSIDCASRSSTLPKQRFYGEYSDLINEQTTNPIKASLGIIKRGCLTCEFNSCCQMPCWISIIFDQYQCTECPFKRIYNYVIDNPDIIDQFNEYEKTVSINYPQFCV